MIGSKTIWHAHPTLHKAIDYMQKIIKEFLFMGGIQQTEFDSLMSISTTTGNDQMRQ